MRSYGLGLGFVAILAATYAMQNQDILAVRIFAWDFALPQGLWDVFLFFLGIVLMWVISLAASWEGRFRSRRELERCRRRVNAPAKERPALRRGHEGRGGVAGRDELHGKRHAR